MAVALALFVVSFVVRYIILQVFFCSFCRHLCVYSMFEQRIDCLELLCGLSFQQPLEQIRIIGYLMWRHVIVGVPPGDTSAVTRLPFILNKYL